MYIEIYLFGDNPNMLMLLLQTGANTSTAIGAGTTATTGLLVLLGYC
jgi:hypothetical protein